MKTVICDYNIDNCKVNLISPIIGRISLDIQNHMVISKQQKIGIIKRNEEFFALQTPDDIPLAQVINLPFKKEFFIECNQVFLSLNAYEQNIFNELQDNIKEDDYVYAAMDGLIYLRSSPLEPFFVNIGDIIKPGQTIALVEVMKNFYSLNFDKSIPMKVSKILVKDASSISYGQALIALEKI